MKQLCIKERKKERKRIILNEGEFSIGCELAFELV